MKLKKHNLKITDFGHIAQDCVWSLQYCFARPLCMWGAIPAGLLPDILTCRMSLMKLKKCDIHPDALRVVNNRKMCLCLYVCDYDCDCQGRLGQSWVEG